MFVLGGKLEERSNGNLVVRRLAHARLGFVVGGAILAADHPSEVWKKHWLREGSKYSYNVEEEFGGEDAAKVQAPKNSICDAWMRFARRGKEGLGQVLAALCECRYTDGQAANPPVELEEDQAPSLLGCSYFLLPQDMHSPHWRRSLSESGRPQQTPPRRLDTVMDSDF